MKNLFFFVIISFTLFQCAEEKPLIDQAIEARCDCLRNFDEEKDNMIEIMQCSDAVNAREEFKDLDPMKIMKGMEKACPDAALPLDQMVQ